MENIGHVAHRPVGNFYTYRVDDDFSGALLGFDELSRSDPSFLSRPLLVTIVNSVTMAVRQVASLAATVTRLRSACGRGLIIC